jgi:hypothetical protein
MGRHLTEEHKRKIGLVHKGKKVSNETKLKMSLAKKGKPGTTKGKLLSPEHKQKMSLAKKGKHHTLETKLKMSLSHKGKLKGIPKSEEHKLKMSLAQKGEKGSNWQGGISTFPYPFDWTDTLKESIRQRDNYICQECGIHQDELDRKLQVHHIDYNKNNLNPTNLISLCTSCHMKTNYYRDKWYEYFQLFFIGYM